jgi:cytosine/creatinine deaminase
MDFLITNARVLDSEELVDISIQGEKIEEVRKAGGKNPPGSVDAGGGLVLPTFIEPHVHLDKALLGEQLKEASSISEARQIVKEAKRKFTVESVQARAEKVLPWAVQCGVTHIRTHVDVDSIAGTTSVEALLKAAEKFRHVIDMQIVAFPQEGLAQNPSSIELVEKALELGCSVVGGMPEAEASPEDSKKHIDKIISLAKKRNLPADVHCDVLPLRKNIEYYATESQRNGLGEKSTADHLIALSYYDDEYASKVISLIRKASMNVITNPCTMLTSGNLDKPPLGRGITRVKELMKAGVNVAFGSDNIVDPYNPFGDFNPLSNGWLLAYGAQLSTTTEINSVIRMPTYCSSTVLGLQNYGTAIDCYADFNVFNEKSIRELVRTRSKPKYVFKRGRKICENFSGTRFFN